MMQRLPNNLIDQIIWFLYHKEQAALYLAELSPNVNQRIVIRWCSAKRAGLYWSLKLKVKGLVECCLVNIDPKLIKDRAEEWVAQTLDLDIIEVVRNHGAELPRIWQLVMELSASQGNIELVTYSLAKGATCSEDAVYKAVKAGHTEIVELLLTIGNINLNNPTFLFRLLCGALRTDNRLLISFFLEKLIPARGETCQLYLHLDLAMSKAARGGHQDLVNLFMSLGASNVDHGLYKAARGDHVALVNFFMDRGATETKKSLIAAAIRVRVKAVEALLARCNFSPLDLDTGMAASAAGGSQYLVDLFANMGATDWNWSLDNGAMSGRCPLELIKILVQRGAKTVRYALSWAKNHMNEEIVDYLKSEVFRAGTDVYYR